MKKNVLSLLLAGCGVLSAAALDLELRNGTTLPDIQFVRPALHGVTLITTDPAGQSHLVTVPFSAISLPSLYSLRQYLMRNNLPSWDSPQIDPPAWSASSAALNLYLRRYAAPAVMLSDGAVWIRLGAPGCWQDDSSPCGGPFIYPQDQSQNQ